ncbi:MAG: type II toxin-antitoxin system RelE/ParE family toxin [Candidatus Azobacteroides sp.]|nr:type II toxin-antitoxin system RelE/ParE family toxin [Candidatus Azobacteroides sp.]
MYKVIINKKVIKSLDKIPVVYISKIKEAINNLVNNPRPFGCIKLSGFENLYRIRVGIYRIIYIIEDSILTIEVIKIDHRRSAYK